MTPYLIGIAIPFVLLIGFLVLVRVEARTGRKILAARRYTLDTKVSRALFVFNHVNWGAFLADLVRSSIERTTHDIAHGALIAVRFIERGLTQVVRTLRSRRSEALPPKSSSPSRTRQMITGVRNSLHRSKTRGKDNK